MLPVIDSFAAGFYFDDQQLTTLDSHEVEFQRSAAEILGDDMKAMLGKPICDQGFPAAGAFIPLR
jgi:hypothetical protein